MERIWTKFIDRLPLDQIKAVYVTDWVSTWIYTIDFYDKWEDEFCETDYAWSVIGLPELPEKLRELHKCEWFSSNSHWLCIEDLEGRLVLCATPIHYSAHPFSGVHASVIYCPHCGFKKRGLSHLATPQH